jgi:hypothetical protein
LIAAVLMTAAIVFSELIARRLIASRARALLVAYLLVASVGLLIVAPRGEGELTLAAPVGALLAIVGYPAGRALLQDPVRPPSRDPLGLELVAFAFVALSEELSWGAVVEPALSLPVTAGLFALKHPLIDGRWRRVLGLGLFWLGLGLLRAESALLAAILHVVLNAVAVVAGRVRGNDSF